MAKYANCVTVFLGFSVATATLFFAGTLYAQEATQGVAASEGSNASFKLDQTVRLIVRNSIETLQNAQTYSAYMHCQAKIYGKIFNGKGVYCHKHHQHPVKHTETVSARWEMEYYFPKLKAYKLSVLNGEQGRLWTLTENRTDEAKKEEEFGEIQFVNLNKVDQAVDESPNNYPSIQAPWYSQPNVMNLLEGILESCDFTMAGETQFPVTGEPIYQIEGRVKESWAKKTLQERGCDPMGGVSALPPEVPTNVELLIDKTQRLPIQIRFYRQKTLNLQKNKEMEFSFTILFEQSHLNNVSLDQSFFELSSGNKMHDVTEQYLEDRRKKE